MSKDLFVTTPDPRLGGTIPNRAVAVQSRFYCGFVTDDIVFTTQLDQLATLVLLPRVPPIPTIDCYWHETSCMSYVASAPFKNFVHACRNMQATPCGPTHPRKSIRPSVSVSRATRRQSWMMCSVIGLLKSCLSDHAFPCMPSGSHQNTCTPRRSGPWCVRRWPAIRSFSYGLTV